MSAQKLAASKRTMSALTNVVRERKIVVRNMPQPLNIEMRPVPKLENGESARSRAEFMTQSSQMLIAKRRYWDALIWLSQIQPIRLQDLIKLTNQINLLFSGLDLWPWQSLVMSKKLTIIFQPTPWDVISMTPEWMGGGLVPREARWPRSKKLFFISMAKLPLGRTWTNRDTLGTLRS